LREIKLKLIVWDILYGNVRGGEGEVVPVFICRFCAGKAPWCAVVGADVVQNPGAYIGPDFVGHHCISKRAIRGVEHHCPVGTPNTLQGYRKDHSDGVLNVCV